MKRGKIELLVINVYWRNLGSHVLHCSSGSAKEAKRGPRELVM